MKHEPLDGARGGSIGDGGNRLLTAAGLVADGSNFDLLSLSSSLVSEEDRAIADELAAVARIAQAHRKLHQVLPEPEPGTGTVPFAASWGHLDLIEVVARGSYGTVYRAWDSRLDRQVALKLFHGARNPEAVMQEGRMLARIRHENVVTVYGADVYNGIAGIWMEFVHGRRLDQIVEQSGPLGVEETVRVGVAVCRALHAVHGAGLLHCDVKAQNVIREQGGRIVLMDLSAGRETFADEDATSKQVAGTPRYMAPEVFDRGSAIAQSDVYSVGVLLFYLSSGKFPVDGKTLNDIRRAHLEARRARITDYRPDLPQPLVRSISRAIDPTPTARHATPSELETELVCIPQHVEPAAPRPSIGWKTIAASIAVLAAIAGALIWSVATSTSTTAPTKLLAVLPIRNLTGDASKGYLADGLTEVLISNLARVRSIRVQSSGAVAEFKDRSEPSSEIAQKLGVDVLVAGSILGAGDGMRLVVQLVDAQSDSVLWSEEFSAGSKDLFAMPGAVARRVAERLSVGLSGEETRALAAKQIDPGAQDAYLRGLVQASSRLDSGIAPAIEYFRQATTRQHDFADAWGHWSILELRQAQYADDRARLQHLAAARTMAARALSIDAHSPVALVALGTAQFYYDWDFGAAERAYRGALEVEPSNVNAQQYLSQLLSATNRLGEALALAEEGIRLEPTSPARFTHLGMMYYYARDFDKAMQQMEYALRLAPGYPTALTGISRVYAARGDYAQSAAYLERAIASGRNFAWVSELACVYAAAGRTDDFRKIQAELETRENKGEHRTLDHVAHLAALDGRLDEGVAALEQSVVHREPAVLWLAVDPRLDAYRSHPRYIELLKLTGLQ